MLGHAMVGLALSAIGGYWVLERSAGQKGRLKQVGQLVGGVIIFVSLVGMLSHFFMVVAASGLCPVKKMGRGYGAPGQRMAPDLPPPPARNAE